MYSFKIDRAMPTYTPVFAVCKSDQRLCGADLARPT